MRYEFSSESVTEGHPDKVCDGISDAILDDIISKDQFARVACETVAPKKYILVMGEITTSAKYDPQQIARDTIKEIGYDEESFGIDPNMLEVVTSIEQQSPDISQGVSGAHADDIGAGDQGMMFGFACNETSAFMPAPVFYAHRLAERLAYARKKGILNYLWPDGKTQVTMSYDNGRVQDVTKIVVAAQHRPGAEEKIKEDILREVIKPVFEANGIKLNGTEFFINNTGRFVKGGPMADTGLTGRKIIADTFGGFAGHGGGAYSGKDPTKVDRSASYMARHVAKNLVAAGAAEKCEVQLAYVIGGRKPLSLFINTFATEKTQIEKIYKAVQSIFDFSPGGIIKYLDLRKPIFRKTTNYGHFGKLEKEFTWERLNKVEEIRSITGL